MAKVSYDKQSNKSIEWLVQLFCDTELQAEKWVASIKMVKQNILEYEISDEDDGTFGRKIDHTKYLDLKIYSKTSSKSTFKDYDVLVDRHEQKVMKDIYIDLEIFMESKKPKSWGGSNFDNKDD